MNTSEERLGMSLDELREVEGKATRLEKVARMLLNTPQQAFYLYDHSAGRFVLGHDALSQLYGYKPGEIEKLKGGWIGIIHPDDVAGFRDLHRELTASTTDGAHVTRMRIKRKKGGYEWVQAHIRALERDENDKLVLEAGMVFIITPMVEAEQTLRETESRCHHLFEHNTAGVLVFDRQFQIVEANPTLCRMLGYRRQQLLKLSALDVTAPGARPSMHTLMRALKNGTKTVATVDCTLEDREGNRVEVMMAPTRLHDAEGGFHQGMLIVSDISERKETEAALRRESDLNRILIDNAPIATGLLSAEGRILSMNATTEKLFGFKLREVKGRELWSLPIMSKAESQASRQRFKMLAEGGASSVSATILMHTRSGETLHMETSTTVVRKPDGSVDFFVTTGRDVTEKRKLETEVIRVAEQEHIRIGHDLHDGVGQTLTGIAAMVEALGERLEGTARKEAHRIYELVQAAIVETRRLSHGLSPAAVKNRGVSGGLMLIAETVRENFRRACECHIEEPVLIVNQEAEIHLFRIGQEAVNNAIRHGAATKIHISLRRRTGTQGMLEIRDNGCGMPAKRADKAVEGIGMRVMEHRASLIDGELTVKSKKGRGVSVVCLFPITPS
ncbi:MAG: PAS domain S-box protein [Prosthecobacter sp.]